MVDLILGDEGHAVLESSAQNFEALMPDSAPPAANLTFGPLTAARTEAPVAEPEPFFLPNLYEYFPNIVRAEDRTLVDRGEVPVYSWDSIPEWDVEPYTWDALIGPEPILKTTTRVMQLELEVTAREIRDLLLQYDLDRVDDDFLPYIAVLLGTPLPSSREDQQREFLRNLVRLYRQKGTPLAFTLLFSSLGFDVTLVEQYQRKGDAELVNGPQMDIVRSSLVTGEDQGVTNAAPGPYPIQLAKRPAIPGTIRVSVFDQSANTATLVRDNGEGSWSDGLAGSIDYDTGAGNFTLDAAPTLIGQPIEVEYRFHPDPFPDPFGNRWTDRFRSSIVAATLLPKTNVQVTEEIAQRLELYRALLKPAHVIFDEAVIRFEFEEDASQDEFIDPFFSLLFVELPSAILRYGQGYAAEDNASLHPDPNFGGAQHRSGEEWIITYEQEADAGPDAPYAYPWFYDGIFSNPIPRSDKEYIGYSPLDRVDSDVSNDISPTTTNVSVTRVGALPAGIQVGSFLMMTDGVAGGEAREITIISDTGAYYDVTVSPGFSVPPEVGDSLALSDEDVVTYATLEDHPEETLAAYWTEEIYNGNGSDTVFSGSSLGKTPVETSSVTLRFTIGSTDYEETDDGVGGFTNTSGEISSASIDYTTGAVDVTFNNPPDGSTTVDYEYATTASITLGAF